VLHPYTCWFILAGIFVNFGGFGEWGSLALATSAKPEKGAKPPVVRPLAAEQHGPAKLPKVDAKPQTRTESSKMVTTVAQGKKSSKRVPRKIRLHQKAVI